MLLGEDETSSKNRMVLICSSCRLVNGQAPPGTKTLAELGKWKCFGCGTLNGEEDEAAKAVKEMKEMIEEKNEDHISIADTVPATEEVSGAKEGEGEVDLGDSDEGTKSSLDAVEDNPRNGKSKNNRKKA